MPAPRPDVVDVFDSGQRTPRRRRLLVATVVLLVLAAAGGLVVRQRLAERVALAASLEVATTATSPPGGAVRWSVAVRNDGARPVRIVSVTTSTDRIVLSSGDPLSEPVQPRQEVDIPVSVRLTCGPTTGSSGLATTVRIRRSDGGSATRVVPLAAAASLLDVVDTLCAVRPGLRGQELSGPVVPGQS